MTSAAKGSVALTAKTEENATYLGKSGRFLEKIIAKLRSEG